MFRPHREDVPPSLLFTAKGSIGILEEKQILAQDAGLFDEIAAFPAFEPYDSRESSVQPYKESGLQLDFDAHHRKQVQDTLYFNLQTFSSEADFHTIYKKRKEIRDNSSTQKAALDTQLNKKDENYTALGINIIECETGPEESENFSQNGNIYDGVKFDDYCNYYQFDSSKHREFSTKYFDPEFIGVQGCNSTSRSGLTANEINHTPEGFGSYGTEQGGSYYLPHLSSAEPIIGCESPSIYAPKSENSISKANESELLMYDKILILDSPSKPKSPTEKCPFRGSSGPLLSEPLPPVDLTSGINTSSPSGVLDSYIQVLGKYLKNLQTSVKLSKELRDNTGAQGVLWVVREAWPEAEHYWKLTASFEGFRQIEMWRNFPCAQTYEALHPAYRPTQTQLSIPHSAIIDWLPWPGIRDLLIVSRRHIDVDTVCKIAIQNMIAHRRVRTQQPKRSCTGEYTTTITSFRVWDLCLLEEQNSSRRKAKNRELINKPKSAAVQALEKAYDLEYDNFLTQKLHPSFFETYPSLYCDSAVSKYSVRDLPSVKPAYHDVGSPKPISKAAESRLSKAIKLEITRAYSRKYCQSQAITGSG